MNKKGFTLIELLAVIVILAIIALIATPIVLNIIKDSRESAGLRSAEMYLKGVETSVATATINNKKLEDGIYPITKYGNICLVELKNDNTCSEEETLVVEMNGETPTSGTVTIESGKIKDITLNYSNDKTIVKDTNGKLVYGNVEGGSGSEELDLSTVNTDLATNTWEDVQKVVKAGKAAEAGWSVGDTKEVEINDQTKTATIIGLDHDGENTATFMVIEGEGIGRHYMNYNSKQYTLENGTIAVGRNFGGWKNSDMRYWLNKDIYNSMTDVKDYIKEVDKLTDNVGYPVINDGVEVTITSDKVFLLSAVEMGIGNRVYNNYPYLDTFNSEGIPYEYFTNSLTESGVNNYIYWLRSPYSADLYCFWSSALGGFGNTYANEELSVLPAFVIG